MSGVSISGILRGGRHGATAEETGGEPVRAVQSAVDPDSEQKLLAAKAAFLEELGRTRPRLATAFASMTVSGNRIGVTVSTELLRDDIVQRQKELGARLRELAGLKGGVEFAIEVREDHSAVRPIKPEDKLAHLRNKNAQIDILRRDLDLEME